ncbi:MAG: VOC family protein [Desertimonas sp.]
MSRFTSYPAGSPCWVDLMTPDVDRGKAFYTAVFGWEPVDSVDPTGTVVYTNFMLGGQTVAGMGATAPGMAPMAIWNTYIATADAAATAAAVTAAGGSVMMPPMAVFDAGTMAVFTDPTGAAFSVWQAGEHVGASVANEADTWSWNELLTRDVESAKAFYTSVFGWSYEDQPMSDGAYTVIAGGDNGGYGGVMSMPPELPDEVPNHWMVYFFVDDVDAVAARVTAAGGTIANGPFDVPGVGRIAVVHDDQNGSFSLMQPGVPEG